MKKKMICAALILAFSLSAYGCGQVSESIDSITGDAFYDADGARKSEPGITNKAASPTEEAAAYSMDDGLADSIAMGVAGEADEGIGVAVSGTIDESTPKDLPEAGQLTAGRWSDNDNWGFFANLVNSDTITFPSFGISPTDRTVVTVKNKDGSPAANAKAELLDKDGNVIWSGVTNKDGVAYLFDQNGSKASVTVENGGQKQTSEIKGSDNNGQSGGSQKASSTEIEFVFDNDAELYKATDIMFIVDTTGSMSDEMLFLQSEFTAITEELGTNNTRYSVNFYRDEGDDYVTKCSDFSTDVKKIQKDLNNETAAGGGDYPEAVAEALNETMFSKDWKDDSVKLAFLIFDAPPHSEKTSELLEATKEASGRGIRLVPVVASDADRETELFGRAVAITTGGTYVFLTDDSGIGNSHEEPIIGNYEVKPLYDTIIEIVNDYRQ